MRIGFGNQTVEDRVVEDPPPLAVVRLGALLTDLADGFAVPAIQPGDGRGLKIRPQAHAAAQRQGAESERELRAPMHAGGHCRDALLSSVAACSFWSSTHCQNSW